jgi:hypothetical protein
MSIDSLVMHADIVATIVGDKNVVVTGITQDSRNVESGDILCCVRGDSFDGHQPKHVDQDFQGLDLHDAHGYFRDRDLHGFCRSYHHSTKPWEKADFPAITYWCSANLFS